MNVIYEKFMVEYFYVWDKVEVENCLVIYDLVFLFCFKKVYFDFLVYYF